MAALVPGVTPPARREPRSETAAGGRWHGLMRLIALFVTIKLHLLGNGWKMSNGRMIAGLIGTAGGLGLAVAAGYYAILLRDAQPSEATLALVTGGSLVVLGWMLLPILVFGVDESMEPRQFVLLPITRRRLLTGMLAAGFVGVPAVATAAAAASTVVTWSRGLLPVLFAMAGAVLVTFLCVVASRAVTTVMSEVLRSQRIRDVISVTGTLALAAVLLLHFGLPSLAQLATRDLLERIAAALAWTPLGAAWAAPGDALAGEPLIGVARLLIVVAAIAALLVGWDRALRRSLENGPSSGRRSRSARADRAELDALTPRWARWLLPGTVTGAVAARILRLWWRDPRQRVSLLVVPVILASLVIGPWLAGFREDVLVLAAPAVGTLIGLMMLNHTAYDGTALWAHLAVSLPGRVDRAGRALGTALWAVPVIVLTAVVSCLLVDRPEMLPGTLGAAAATLLAGLALASVTSVVFAFPASPPGANPFVTPSGGNVVVVLQQLLGGFAVMLLSLPVYVGIIAALWWRSEVGWALLVAGPAYGLLLLRFGNRIGGRYLDQNGPELLARITPTRT